MPHYFNVLLARQRGTTGSSPPVAAPPLQTHAVAAHKWPQLAANGLDLSQGLPSKFDLGFQHVDISQRDSRDHKVIDVIF